MKTARRRPTTTGGRDATLRRVMGDVALAIGKPVTHSPPKGWRWVALGDIATMESGHTPSRRHPEYWDGDIPWISVKDARGSHGGVMHDTEEHTNQLGIDNSSARLLPTNTVCLSRGGTVGYVFRLGRPMATSQGFANWICGPNLSPEFLAYLFLRERSALDRFASGTTIQTIYYPDLKAFHVCLPPLPEQRRIVAILDEAFEGIAAAKANAERNLKNARESCDARLHKAMVAAKDAYSCTTLGALCEFENGDRGKNYPSKDARVAEGVPFINAGHLKEDGLDLSEMDYISRDRFALLGAGKIRPHDILFCLRGSLGKFASVGRLAEGAIASSLVILRPKAGVSPEFISAYLGSHICSAMIAQNRNGAAQPNLSAKSVAAFAVPNLPLAAQEKIAALSGAAQADRKALQRCILAKCAALDELKASLLHQAFTGNL